MTLSTIMWSAEFTVDADGILSGAGSGVFHTDGTVFDRDVKGRVVGSWTGDASFTVTIDGAVDAGELGPVLRIWPAPGSPTISSDFTAPGYEHGVQESLNQIIPELIQQAFTELDLTAGSPDSVYATVAAEGWEGSAILTPLR